MKTNTFILVLFILTLSLKLKQTNGFCKSSRKMTENMEKSAGNLSGKTLAVGMVATVRPEIWKATSGEPSRFGQNPGTRFTPGGASRNWSRSSRSTSESVDGKNGPHSCPRAQVS